ncbi:hypothetical protein KA037_02085 [Patescibacteria group bacterium]|nr:hypothetical protein [Patescibacteria group bacterium]
MPAKTPTIIQETTTPKTETAKPDNVVIPTIAPDINNDAAGNDFVWDMDLIREKLIASIDRE